VKKEEEDNNEDQQPAPVALASPGAPLPPVVFINQKRPSPSPVAAPQPPAKKPALDVKNLITPVMTQAIFRDNNSREKLTVVITMPVKPETALFRSRPCWFWMIRGTR
jgi:hypothetical protein